MSFMDRKNILEEGFFDKLIKGWKKAKSDSKIKKDKELQKLYDDAMDATMDAKKSLDAALRKRGIDPKKYEV